MARLIRTALIWLLVAGIIAAALLYARAYIRDHPQDVPWTPLRLDDPIGFFTLRKLASLSDQPAQCRALLDAAGSGDVAAPPRSSGAECGYEDGMRLAAAEGELRFEPEGVVTSCPVAAALVVFERQVVQLAALRHFGKPVREIRHAGSYSCRRLYGREEGAYSEHATADAIDLTGFVLEDGNVISVLRDWEDGGAKGAFLEEVRDGACRVFATSLSPDYNEAHADHLHLDQAERGRSGFSLCR